MQLGLDLLRHILALCPGMLTAYIELSRAYLAMGKYDESARTLQSCLTLSSSQSSPALIAMALVEVNRFKTNVADRLLEQALACDFAIRNSSKFKLVKAIIRAQQHKFTEEAQEMESILNQPEFGYNTSHVEQNDMSAAQSTKANHAVTAGVSVVLTNYADALRLTEDDRVTGFVCYAGILSKERRLKEANKVLAYAKVLFAGSAQEVAVLVAASQLYVEKGDFDAAIRMLDKISVESSSFAWAQMVKAEIILQHNHDKEGFCKVFEHLVELDPTTHHLILLGDAYLKILNPESAIDALERAYKQEPLNGRLRAKIGRALIATHEYHRAVEFYESALRETARQQGSNPVQSVDTLTLAHDLAKLYGKLGRYESAARILINSIHSTPGNDVTLIKQNVSTYLILAHIQSLSAPIDVLDTLFKAYGLQKDLLLKLRTNNTTLLTSSSDSLEDEKTVLSTICEGIGKQFLEEENMAESEKSYQEALLYSPQNTKAMLGLARHFALRKEIDNAVAQCNKILMAVPTDREAVLFVADLLLPKDEVDKVLAPFVTYLSYIPNDYMLLERFLSILRKVGKLSLAVDYFRAIVEFYESALRETARQQGSNPVQSVDTLTLAHDLAKLYGKLGRYESSARILINSIHSTLVLFVHESVSLGGIQTSFQLFKMPQVCVVCRHL